jgi:hypothetical protein
MGSSLVSQTLRIGSRCVSRSAPFIAVLVLTAQVAAQNPMIPDAADLAGSAQGLPRAAQATAAPAQFEGSTPAPAQELASLASRETTSFFSLVAGPNGGQSSSQDGTRNMPATGSNQKKAAPSNKPPHHALGVTLAVVGVTALVAGAVLFAGEKAIGFCNGESSGGCGEAKYTGIALMPIGGAVAVTGFYLQFHR